MIPVCVGYPMMKSLKLRWMLCGSEVGSASAVVTTAESHVSSEPKSVCVRSTASVCTGWTEKWQHFFHMP